MLPEEFDINKYERSLREEGLAAGRKEGLAVGREEGEARLASLLNRLFSDNRMDDAKRILTDQNLREKLYTEYKIK